MGAARGCVPTQSVRPLFLSTTFTVPDYVIIYTIQVYTIGKYRWFVGSSLPPPWEVNADTSAVLFNLKH